MLFLLCLCRKDVDNGPIGKEQEKSLSQAQNFCRNGENSQVDDPWCYIDVAEANARDGYLYKGVPWDFCDIPICSTFMLLHETHSFVLGFFGRGRGVTITHSVGLLLAFIPQLVQNMCRCTKGRIT